jgi:hypothetical protein
VSEYYILEGREVVPCDVMASWAKWFEQCDRRRVAQDNIGVARISTVFLGINYAWGGGPPLVFETRVFGGEHDEFQERCSTYAEAEEMHARACLMVREEIPAQVTKKTPDSAR